MGGAGGAEMHLLAPASRMIRTIFRLVVLADLAFLPSDGQLGVLLAFHRWRGGWTKVRPTQCGRMTGARKDLGLLRIIAAGTSPCGTGRTRSRRPVLRVRARRYSCATRGALLEDLIGRLKQDMLKDARPRLPSREAGYRGPAPGNHRPVSDAPEQESRMPEPIGQPNAVQRFSSAEGAELLGEKQVRGAQLTLLVERVLLLATQMDIRVLGDASAAAKLDHSFLHLCQPFPLITRKPATSRELTSEAPPNTEKPRRCCASAAAGWPPF